MAKYVKIRFLLKLVGNLNCSSGLFYSENLIIFKLRNKFDLKNNFVNNLKKLECLQMSKFLRFKMI